MSDGLTLRGPSLRRNELLRPGLGEPVEVGEQQGLDQLVWWIVGGGGGGGLASGTCAKRGHSILN